MRKMIQGLATCMLCAAAVFGASGASAGDWPQFLGPERDGTANEAGLLKTWPEDGPTTAWTADLGAGFGGPVVVDGHVYLLDRVETEADVLRCWSLETGEEKWAQRYEAPARFQYPGSRSTPTVGPERVYTLGPLGDLRAWDRSTGEPVWSVDVLEDYEAARPHWAVAQSPLLRGDVLYVAPCSSKAGVVALNAATGEDIWRSQPFEGGMGYASPVFTTVDGVDQILHVTDRATYGVAAEDGATLWSYGGFQCQNPIPNPLPLGEGRFFLMGGYNAGARFFEIAESDDGWTSETLVATDTINGQIHTPIVIDGHIYANANGSGRKSGLQCVTLDGEVLWETGREPNFGWGGMLYADGRLYCVDDPQGDLVMIEPSPEGYRELARAHFLEGRQIWAPIAIGDGRILMRDQTRLVCVDLRAK